MTLETLIPKEKYKEIFYGKEEYDYETVAVSIVVINEEELQIPTISANRKHAEEYFMMKL